MVFFERFPLSDFDLYAEPCIRLDGFAFVEIFVGVTRSLDRVEVYLLVLVTVYGGRRLRGVGFTVYKQVVVASSFVVPVTVDIVRLGEFGHTVGSLVTKLCECLSYRCVGEIVGYAVVSTDDVERGSFGIRIVDDFEVRTAGRIGAAGLRSDPDDLLGTEVA